MSGSRQDGMDQEHLVTGIPLHQKDALLPKEEVRVRVNTYTQPTKKESRLKKHLILLCKDNYVHGAHVGSILFGVAVIWGAIFCIMNQLGVHAAVLGGVSAIVGVIAGIASEDRRWHIAAGIAFPIHALGIILFTTLFVFNPSKEYIAVYRDAPPTLIRYAQEPWVTRYVPEVWQNAMFFERSFTTTINKYVDFDKKDLLITFTVDFVLSSEKAQQNVTRIDKDSMAQDKGVAAEVMTALVIDTVKEVLADPSFVQSIESVETLLASLPVSERHSVKRKMFHGALENFLRQSEKSTPQTLLYIPDPRSAKITVLSAIYTRPVN